MEASGYPIPFQVQLSIMAEVEAEEHMLHPAQLPAPADPVVAEMAGTENLQTAQVGLQTQVVAVAAGAVIRHLQLAALVVPVSL